MTKRFTIIKGDIVKQNVEAIVNAAQNNPLYGGDLPNQTHLFAGPELSEECKKLKLSVGEAIITSGYKLSAKWIIHTFCPEWKGGDYREDYYLAKCYRNCFSLIEKHSIKTVAFPSMGTGGEKFNIPTRLGTTIAINEIKKGLEKNPSIEKLILVCWEPVSYAACLQALQA